MHLSGHPLLRTFALIVSAHPYGAQNWHATSCIERALSSEVNNNRENGHCYNFCVDLTIFDIRWPLFFLLMGHFLYRFSKFCEKIKKIYQVEVWNFCKMLHQIPFIRTSSFSGVAVSNAGSEINFFRQVPTGDQNFFFSHQMGKCGLQKLSLKLFLCSETQAKIIGRHRLAKIFAIDVIRNQTSAEIIFWPLWQIYIATFWRPENIYQ